MESKNPKLSHSHVPDISPTRTSVHVGNQEIHVLTEGNASRQECKRGFSNVTNSNQVSHVSSSIRSPPVPVQLTDTRAGDYGKNVHLFGGPQNFNSQRYTSPNPLFSPERDQRVASPHVVTAAMENMVRKEAWPPSQNEAYQYGRVNQHLYEERGGVPHSPYVFDNQVEQNEAFIASQANRKDIINQEFRRQEGEIVLHPAFVASQSNVRDNPEMFEPRWQGDRSRLSFSRRIPQSQQMPLRTELISFSGSSQSEHELPKYESERVHGLEMHRLIDSSDVRSDGVNSSAPENVVNYPGMQNIRPVYPYLSNVTNSSSDRITVNAAWAENGHSVYVRENSRRNNSGLNLLEDRQKDNTLDGEGRLEHPQYNASPHKDLNPEKELALSPNDSVSPEAAPRPGNIMLNPI